jgi:hypothetical protein
MLAQEVEGLADAGQHAERQHVDLHQAEFVNVVLVPFDEGAVLHGRVPDGHEFVEPPAGQHEAADMLREVAREAEEAGREIDRAADRRIGGIEPSLTDVLVGKAAAPTPPDRAGELGGHVLGKS